LALNGTLKQGEYAFVLSVRTPPVTPSPNLFSVLVTDANGAVEDAAMDIPGRIIHYNVPIVVAPLSWTSADAGQASTITVGFTTSDDITHNRLDSMLITFPENFAHAIERESSVVSTNSQLPLGTGNVGGWIDIRMVDRLLVHIDPTQIIPKGTYEFQFPVTVPEQMPVYNVWLVTFCQVDHNRECVQAHGPNALLTFPLAGFVHGELHSNMKGVLQGHALRSARSSFQCTLAVVLSILAASWWT